MATVSTPFTGTTVSSSLFVKGGEAVRVSITWAGTVRVESRTTAANLGHPRYHDREHRAGLRGQALRPRDPPELFRLHLGHHRYHDHQCHAHYRPVAIQRRSD